MKVYISADIEGITGVTHWDETEEGKAGYSQACEQMTAEVAAACDGALQAGASELWVKDAHDSARNLIAARLPQQARLIRGWSMHPFTMLQELDSSFDALALVGYHTRAAGAGNPLAHTMTGQIAWLKINGAYASEFTMAAYTAGLVKVPLVFLSGDQELCEAASTFLPGIQVVAVKQGIGGSSINLHPQLAVERIRSGVAQGLQNRAACQVSMPSSFQVEIEYRYAKLAYHIGFYPGARQTGPINVCFEHSDYFEVLRFLLFALWLP